MRYHIGLTVEKWQLYPFLIRLSHIGSEVYRTITAKEKNWNNDSILAFNRSLELIDLTLETNLKYSQIKELCRLRELWTDFIVGDNQYRSDKKFFENYFNYITVRARL